MVAFVTAAYLVLIPIVTRAAQLAPALRRAPTVARWAAFVVLMALATYSSFVAVLVIPAQLLVLLPRAPARARAPVHRIAFCRLRGAVRAAVRARGSPRLGSAVLGPETDAQDRGAGAPGADLRGSSAELSPHRDDDPAADRDGGRVDRDRRLGGDGCGGSARAAGASGSRSPGWPSRSRSRSSTR